VTHDERTVALFIAGLGVSMVSTVGIAIPIVVASGYPERIPSLLAFLVFMLAGLVGFFRVAFRYRWRLGRLFWAGLTSMFGALLAASWPGDQVTMATVAAILFAIDWWRSRPPRNRKRKPLLSYLPKWRPLAWGVPARRPMLT
jgi:O-antigen/teichoic acid export membrane protein